MNELLYALRTYIILSIQDLTKIKTSISRQYAHLTDFERAEMLSLAVHNLLNKHLVGIESSQLESIKLQILTDTLAKHVYEITRYDIFESIFKQSLSDETKVSLAESWLAETVKILVPKWALQDYLSARMTPVKNTTSITPNTTVLQNAFLKLRWQINYESFNRLLSRLFPRVAIALMVLFAIIFALQFFTSINKNSQAVTQLMIIQDYSAYQGLSALDRVYLIDHLSGSETDGVISLTLHKQVLPFGVRTHISRFSYEPFDYFKVKHYITGARNGLIGLPEHFNRVLHIAYLNNIDPLLLLAIIGQEQAFVQMDSNQSNLIINNPYNVYHSWSEYNTTLRDSTQIAINTIKNRLSNAPLSESPFSWLNIIYAEDPNWHNGVRLIYAHLDAIGRGD